MSFGELSRLPWYESAMIVTEPSCSYRTTRLVRCSQDSWRPWKSNVLPLLLFDGMRKTVTRPLSSSQRICRLFGISLHTRYRPTPLHAGPSDQSAPVHNRWIGAFGCRRPLKIGSMVSTSGSVKETFGGALGPKSRGGVVIVLGGAIGAGA